MRTPLLLAVICLFFTGCAREHVFQQQFADDRFIHMAQIQELEKVEDIDNYVYYLDKGDTIPLKLLLDSEVMEFAEEEINISLKKKIFFRCDTSTHLTERDKEILYSLTAETMVAMDDGELEKLLKNIRFFISTDGNSWALLTDMRGLKQVLGFDHGQLELGMGMNKDEGMWLMISLIMQAMEQTSS